MKKIFFDTIFLLGLYLILRQIQLSIDRVLDDEWKKLVEFFKAKISVDTVTKKLIDTGLIDIDFKVDADIKRPLASTKLLLLFGRNNYLVKDELIYICSLLQLFSNLLSKTTCPNKDTLIRLRLDLLYSEELVRGRINNKDLAGKEYVEHFNQNEALNCKPIEVLVGDAWI